jgi:hypothetical protein
MLTSTDRSPFVTGIVHTVMYRDGVSRINVIPNVAPCVNFIPSYKLLGSGGVCSIQTLFLPSLACRRVDSTMISNSGGDSEVSPAVLINSIDGKEK